MSPFSLRRMSLLLGLSLLAGIARAESWPQPDWQTVPHSDSPALAALEDYAFPPRDDATRLGVRSDALLVVRDGRIVYERYAAPTRADTAHLTWSMAKSLLATTLGVAYGEGRFKLDAPVAKYYPAMAEHSAPVMKETVTFQAVPWPISAMFGTLRLTW